ncbi:VOC family protein [Angustibacter luteus]|uniref:VOC family protein n=1 Tax=Angustibacter luteus TaxID=658456 RepID=A0ABW1JAV0_9ACTN
MKLAFVYAPVTDLDQGAAFYRDTLGWAEAWRDGDDTVAFAIPDSDVQVMVSTTPQEAGPMYLVDDVAEFLAAHADLPVVVDPFAIPDGQVAGVADPAGNVLYVFDQAGGES